MMDILLHSISRLYCITQTGKPFLRGAEMSAPDQLENAWVAIRDGKIHSLGTGTPPAEIRAKETLDCSGRIVFPGFCDSHTHIVFARSREEEFVDKINGLTYEDIAKRGGGILNSARRLRAATEAELLESAVQRAREMLECGTTTMEIKSGYGLTVEDELKMLRVARRIPEHVPVSVKTTLLGAHALPPEFRDNREEYLRTVREVMIPRAAEEGLADFTDAFCEKGYFTVGETLDIIRAGEKSGLKAKIHVNQFHVLGGVKPFADAGVLSVDHLEKMDDADLEALSASSTVATLLPGCSFFLNIDFAPARKLIQQGAVVALATDYNPGSAPGGSMLFVISLACIRMKMLPEEALTAATLNGAAALGLSDRKGSIETGKDADLVITTPMENLAQIPYFFTRNPVAAVISNGKRAWTRPGESL